MFLLGYCWSVSGTNIKTFINVSPYLLLITDQIFGKKISLIVLRHKFFQNFCLWCTFSVSQLWVIWKSSLELNFSVENRYQHRYQYRTTFWGGGWKGDQILKYSLLFTMMKMLLEISSFILIRYIICFLVEYYRVTVTLSFIITWKNFYLNLLEANFCGLQLKYPKYFKHP